MLTPSRLKPAPRVVLDPTPEDPPGPQLGGDLPKPAPAMPTDPKTPWTDIPAIKSRTLWAFGITVLLFVLSKLLGLDIDLDALGINAGDGWNVGELLLLVGGAIMAFFRKKAQGPISGITKPK